MFSFFKSKNKKSNVAISDAKITEVLVEQVLWMQHTILYNLFVDVIKCEDSSIRKFEITYLATSIMTHTYFRSTFLTTEQKKRGEILDSFTLSILKNSISSLGENISLKIAVEEYQSRFSEYKGLLNLVSNPEKSTTGNPEITLLIHAFESITNTSAKNHMMTIMVAAGFITKFLVDNINLFDEVLKEGGFK